jgi:hypothetical protein
VLHLLPNYDELVVAYRDHAASLAPGVAGMLRSRPDAVANHLVAVDGRVVGGWRRLEAKGVMTVETNLIARFARDARAGAGLKAAAARFQKFLAMPVKVRAAAPARGARSSATGR